jgi:diaminohydroxyphosphoribosylaminopyrimidine deaminase/5-amino-6-(5-phosphoribosylamino)uracil reductase
MFSADDHRFMARALELAERGLFTATPNPRVGCVIVSKGEVVGEGWHEKAGGPHAEVNALKAAGANAKGASAYVTLEPCNHHGRTPPCTEALIQSGVTRVVAATADPNPKAGGGLQHLAAAGVEVESGLMEDAARMLNAGFFSRMTRGRPWLRLKVAASLDGRTALENGNSQWITGAEARRDGHAFRARACAVLTGIGTVRDDDPRLNVREVETPRQPLRVVVDSRFDISLAAKILGGGPVLIAIAQENPAKSAALRAMGADTIVLPNAGGKVDLPALLQELARRECNEVHVEAGFRLNGSLLREGLIDELLLYIAPIIVGDAAQGMFDLPALTELSAARRLAVFDRHQIGDDMRIRATLKPAQ